MAAMVSTPSEIDPDDESSSDQRVVMRGQSWKSFQTLIALRGERGRPRLAYLDGAVELMTPSHGHEITKTRLGDLLTIYCLDRDILISGIGEWLLEDNSEEAGAEPDECFIFGPDPEKPKPDLVIEVEWSRGRINKLEIYRRLGIDEVWRWRRDAITVCGLVDGKYIERRSCWLPDLDLTILCEFARISPMNEAVKQMRERMPISR
jgi:Uma2 family endonuclease